MSKPRAGIFGLTGCAGDQLVILNCEDELLDLVSLLDMRDFLMAASDNDTACDLDIALVEGAVFSRRDKERLERIRQRSAMLVAIGSCAVWGGVSAAERNGGLAGLLDETYGTQGRDYDATEAYALHQVVKVDLKITGCPIEKHEFVAAVASLLNGDPPVYPQYPVCTECKMRESNCLLIEKSIPCCGPLTVAGCGARCPALRIPCIGCRGPAADANAESARQMLAAKGVPEHDIRQRLRTFAPTGGSA
ncbi:MAG: NADH:ubiquinone oxidoreductase [Bryobacteraceae bacterium]|nr:NADH:ubiquinone oxidoreductase [Bryobacteraceae bacterium]